MSQFEKKFPKPKEKGQTITCDNYGIRLLQREGWLEALKYYTEMKTPFSDKKNAALFRLEQAKAEIAELESK